MTQINDILKALADPTTLDMFKNIAQGLDNCEIYDPTFQRDLNE